MDGGPTAAIMQPTFLPWTGYFAMILESDVFIFLDDVQLNHRSWQNRNLILSQDGPRWLTLPLQKKGLQSQLVLQAQVAEDMNTPKRILGTLRHAYARAPFFLEVFPTVEKLVNQYLRDGLAALNIELVKQFSRWLYSDTKFLRSSELELANTYKAERLAEICRAIGAEKYLAAEGSRTYLEEAGPGIWSGITVSYFKYRHPSWPQLGDQAFQTNLSIIDLFMNDFDNAAAVVRSGIVRSDHG